MDTATSRNQSRQAVLPPGAPALLLLLMLVVGTSEAFQTTVFGKHAVTLLGVNNRQAFPAANQGNNNLQPFFAFTTTTKKDNIHTMLLAATAGGDEDEAPPPPAVSGSRTKAEVALLLDEALNTYMESLTSGAPTVEQDKRKMEELATEYRGDTQPAPAATTQPVVATSGFPPLPVTKPEEAPPFATSGFPPIAKQPEATSGSNKPKATSGFPVAKKAKAPYVSPSLELMGFQSKNVGTVSTKPKVSSEPLKPVVQPPKQDYGTRMNFPSAQKSEPKPDTKPVKPTPVSPTFASRSSTTVVPISDDPPSNPVEGEKPLSQTVVPLSEDPPSVPVEGRGPVAQTVVSVSDDPPSSPIEGQEPDSTTVVPISQADPASMTVVPIAQPTPAEPTPEAKSAGGNVKVVVSKPTLVPESTYAAPKPKMESEPARAPRPRQRRYPPRLVEIQPTLAVLPVNGGGRGDSVAEDIALVENIAKAEDLAKAEDIAKADKATPSQGHGPLPPIAFLPNDKPDEDQLRELLDAATVWFVTHGNEVDDFLRQEVEGMIEEMAHFLYYASVDDDEDDGIAETVKGPTQLSPDSNFDSSGSNFDSYTNEIVSKRADSVPTPPSFTSGTLKVSGSSAVDFFRERINALQGNEGNKAEEEMDTEDTNRAPVTESTSTADKAPEARKSMQMQSNADYPLRSDPLAAVDAAFKMMTPNMPGTATTSKSKSRDPDCLPSDNTYVLFDQNGR